MEVKGHPRTSTDIRGEFCIILLDKLISHGEYTGESRSPIRIYLLNKLSQMDSTQRTLDSNIFIEQIESDGVYQIRNNLFNKIMYTRFRSGLRVL